jgi:hypothetical protein
MMSSGNPCQSTLAEEPSPVEKLVQWFEEQPEEIQNSLMSLVRATRRARPNPDQVRWIGALFVQRVRRSAYQRAGPVE